MPDTALLHVPLKVLFEHARKNPLPYFNRRQYDYTYANFAVIPWVINTWADDGIDLSHAFAEQIWERFAKKVDGNSEGEMLRTCKLINDAFRGIHDHSAWAEYAGVQVTYRPSDDMKGRDLKLQVPSVGPVWVQMAFRAAPDIDTANKQRRLASRGIARSDAIQVIATMDDADTIYNPYLPCRKFYMRSLEMIIERSLGAAA